jgi:LmbE family N-acetylglucosaminyl deacetylase
MLQLSRLPAGDRLHLLCLGAHSDDIEIGCGGTILQLLRDHPGSRVTWVVLSAAEHRREEAEVSAAALLRDAPTTEIVLESFRDGYFPWEGAGIKDLFESLGSQVEPDLIFTHSLHDRHQDHRLVQELTWNTFRNHLILEYEVPKYDGDLASPNVFVPLDERTAAEKARHLLQYFPSQRDRHWFSADTFNALMRLRGIECRSPSGLAEGFYCRKMIL